jgi:hypothetical protein
MSIKKAISKAIDAGAAALLSTKRTKPLSEMPETPLLVLPEGKQATATADFGDDTRVVAKLPRKVGIAG